MSYLILQFRINFLLNKNCNFNGSCPTFKPNVYVFNDPKLICQAVFDEYYEMIGKLKLTGTFPGCKNEKASLEDKKLEIIARICQNLDQMHLFFDGNIRTIGFLLLNKFLIENDLSPTIMYDPNMIDFRSIAEIIHEIKKGQELFKKVFPDFDNFTAPDFDDSTAPDFDDSTAPDFDDSTAPDFDDFYCS